MKPLPVAPLTTEDYDAWRDTRIRWIRRGGDGSRLRALSKNTDRRDAELMLTLTRGRNGLKSLKKAVRDMYDTLTPKEQEVMARVFGTRRPE